jgi:hypothetical protein
LTDACFCFSRSCGKPWRKLDPNYNPNWDYNPAFCHPQKDHLPLEEAFELWKLYLESWAEMTFGQSKIIVGLGTSKIDDSQYILFDLADVHSLLLGGSLQSADGNFFFATSAETKSTASPAARGSSVRPAEGRSHFAAVARSFFVPPVLAAVRTALGSAI